METCIECWLNPVSIYIVSCRITEVVEYPALKLLNNNDITMTKFILKFNTSFEAYKRYIYVQI